MSDSQDCVHGTPLYTYCNKCATEGAYIHGAPSSNRAGNLGEVIDRRVQVYGDPTKTFVRIAQVWSGILGHEVQPVEVPLMMAGMKMVRTQVMPDYSDNSDDIDGYLDIFRKLVGDDMIHARTVDEFIEKKWPAAAPTKKLENELAYLDSAACERAGQHLHSARHGRALCPVPEVVG